jgi:Sec-independent protein secretion pathway component TatC
MALYEISILAVRMAEKQRAASTAAAGDRSVAP